MSQRTISLLGSPSIAVDGEPIRVDTRKAVAMVAFLALNPGAQSREALAALLWPDLNQTRSLAALRRTLSVLNKCPMSPWLTIERSDVALRIDRSVEIDVAAFHRDISECVDHGHAADGACPRCIAPLTRAAERYRSDFIVAYIDAADQAASVYANYEAIRYLESALALGSDEGAAIHERLGDLRTLLGEYLQARNNYEAAAAMGQAADTSRLECKLGDLHHRLGNLDLAHGHYAVAVEDAALDQAWRCRALALWSLVAEQAGNRTLATTLAQDSLAASEGSGDLSALAYAHDVLSILARHAGKTDAAIDHARQSVEITTQSDTPTARVAALNSLALAHAAAGEHEEAIKLTDQALAIATARGDRRRAAALHDHLADYYRAMGKNVVAAEQVKLAVQLFAEISADGLDQNPAIWMLVDW